MNIKEAREAIEQILASIPDHELPEFDKVEDSDDGRVTVWWGGSGAILGTAKSGGRREPHIYRERGSWAAIEGEMTYRADLRYLQNGDKLSGIRLARKVG